MILVFSLELFFSFFLNFCCWKLSFKRKRLGPKIKGKGKRRRVFFVVKNISENISTTRPAQRQKRRKKASFDEEEIFSLWKGGRASSLLPSSSSSSLRKEEQPSRNTERKKKSTEQHEHGQKIPTSGGERKCCWAFYWSREVCVCARFPPLISLRKAYLLVSSFDNFSSFWWENCPSETFLFSLSLSLWFFFCRFGKKGTKRRKNQHKKSLTARVRRASTTLST